MPRYRLLYIEDNPINALVVEELLMTRPDIELVVEPTGQGGLARAETWQPQLVLLDHELPDLSGQQVLALLRVLQPGMPVVSLSATDMPQPGFDACWSKPIDFPSFRAGIDGFLKPEANPCP